MQNFFGQQFNNGFVKNIGKGKNSIGDYMRKDSKWFYRGFVYFRNLY